MKQKMALLKKMDAPAGFKGVDADEAFDDDYDAEMDLQEKAARPPLPRPIGVQVGPVLIPVNLIVVGVLVNIVGHTTVQDYALGKVIGKDVGGLHRCELVGDEREATDAGFVLVDARHMAVHLPKRALPCRHCGGTGHRPQDCPTRTSTEATAATNPKSAAAAAGHVNMLNKKVSSLEQQAASKDVLSKQHEVDVKRLESEARNMRAKYSRATDKLEREVDVLRGELERAEGKLQTSDGRHVDVHVLLATARQKIRNQPSHQQQLDKATAGVRREARGATQEVEHLRRLLSELKQQLDSSETKADRWQEKFRAASCRLREAKVQRTSADKDRNQARDQAAESLVHLAEQAEALSGQAGKITRLENYRTAAVGK